MLDRLKQLTPAGQRPLGHALAFLISGGTAFAIDALALKLLTAWVGMHPIAARVLAIAVAMIAGWLMHRTFTFRTGLAPTVAEFLRYIGVAWSSAAVNYAVFVAILLTRPSTEPLIALVLSSAVAMVFAYLGMRLAAFRRAGDQD
ncbi:MAG TPA: GtrA family protein [Hyphomicrobiaceae bacterium]|nr:GtrA family protein [Hyphomicrobiaceae bacterium]